MVVMLVMKKVYLVDCNATPTCQALFLLLRGVRV